MRGYRLVLLKRTLNWQKTGMFVVGRCCEHETALKACLLALGRVFRRLYLCIFVVRAHAQRVVV